MLVGRWLDSIEENMTLVGLKEKQGSKLALGRGLGVTHGLGDRQSTCRNKAGRHNSGEVAEGRGCVIAKPIFNTQINPFSPSAVS